MWEFFNKINEISPCLFIGFTIFCILIAIAGIVFDKFIKKDRFTYKCPHCGSRDMIRVGEERIGCGECRKIVDLYEAIIGGRMKEKEDWFGWWLLIIFTLIILLNFLLAFGNMVKGRAQADKGEWKERENR